MTYTTVEAVKKEALNIDPLDETDDVLLQDLITTSDAFVDSLLLAAGRTMPSPVPALLAACSKYYAGHLYRLRIAPPAEAKNLFDLALQCFRDWASGQSAEDGIAMVTGEADAE